jgi:hypothetical protein
VSTFGQDYDVAATGEFRATGTTSEVGSIVVRLNWLDEMKEIM